MPKDPIKIKRVAETVDEPKKRRQLPVSCYFCRQKKLKCDRETPCDTCIKRNIGESCTPAAVIESSAASTDRKRSTVRSETISVGPANSYKSATISGTSGLEDEPMFGKYHASDRTSTLRLFDRAASGHEYLFEHGAEELANPEIADAVNAIAILIYPFQPRLQGVPELRASLSQLLSMSQALRLLDHYSDKVSWALSLIHPPSLKASLLELYQKSPITSTLDTARLSLLCAVLGLSAYFHSPSLNMDGETAARHATKLLGMVPNCLEYCDFAQCPMLESLQAAFLVMYFLGPNTLSIHDKGPAFTMLAHLSARHLRMHQVDLDVNKERRTREGCNHVEVELMRRLWWAVVSCEWLYADGSGLLRYDIHPNHFRVDYPAHADNAAIDSDGVYSRPWSVPTDMSYFIQRLRVAEIARQINDACASSGLASRAGLDYDLVLTMDARLQAECANAPAAFQIDDESLKATQALRRERPYITYQMFVAHIGLHSKLTQLHRPYLSRAMKDLRYDYSRTVCIESARAAIHISRQMHLAELDCSPLLLQLSTATKNLFLAVLTLAMEYHYNSKDSSIRDDIAEGCRILEQYDSESTIARQGVRALRAILDEWKQANKGNDRPPEDSVSIETGRETVSMIESHVPMTQDPSDLGPQYGSTFDWLDLDHSLDFLEWDNLFKQLDSV